MRAPARALPWVVGVAAAAYQLAFPLAIGRADESFLLVGARRVLAGDVIYRDFFELLTPLGFYLYAGVFALGGTTLLAARVAAALINGVGCGLAFALARRIAGPLDAAVAALAIPIVCVPAWPYASPHWLSTTLWLGVAAMLLSERLRASSRLRPVLAGALGGTACCVQQQRGVYIAAWAVVALLILAAGRPRETRWRAARREVGWLALGGLVVVTAVLGHAAWAASPRSLYQNLFVFVFENYQKAVAPVSWASTGFLAEAWIPQVWRTVFRWAPVGLVIEGFALLRAARAGAFDRGARIRLCLLVLAVFAMASIRYFPDYVHVAYVMPFLLIPWARNLSGLRGLQAFRAGPGRWVPAGIVAGLLGLLLAEGAGNLARAWRESPRRIDTAFGTMHGDEQTERLVSAVRAAVERDPPGDRQLFVFPADAWLYLVAGARNSTRFTLLWQGYNSPAQIEDALADVRRHRPGTLVVNTVLAPADDRVRQALERDYDVVAELPAYRVYRRRSVETGP